MSDKQSPGNKKSEEIIKRSNDLQKEAQNAFRNNRPFSANVSFVFTDQDGRSRRGQGKLVYSKDYEKSNRSCQTIYNANIQGYFPQLDKDGSVVTVTDKNGKTVPVIDNSRRLSFDNVNHASYRNADRVKYDNGNGNTVRYLQGADSFSVSGNINPRYSVMDRYGEYSVTHKITGSPVVSYKDKDGKDIVYASKNMPKLEYRIYGDINYINEDVLEGKSKLTEDEMDQKAYTYAKYKLNYFNKDNDKIRTREIKGNQVKATNPGRTSKKKQKEINSMTKEELDEKKAEIYARYNTAKKDSIYRQSRELGDISIQMMRELYNDDGYKEFQENCKSWRKQSMDEFSYQRRLKQNKDK